MDTIKTDNELIAKFMEYEMPERKDSYDTAEFLARAMSVPRYDTSWDWLMPVVEKIESINRSEVKIWRNECNISYYSEDGFWNHFVYAKKTKMKSTYSAVVDFIKWYNEQNQTKP